VSRLFFLYGLLFAVATAWGLSNPLAKIAVSSGYQPLGVMFWQVVTILILSGAVTLLRHGTLPFRADTLPLFAGVAVIGTLVPDYLLYLSAAHLPAGIFSILLGMIPVLSLSMALALGFERPDFRRALGVAFGAVAIILMIGPEASLPPGTPILFAVLCLVAAACYGGQGIFLTWYGSRDLDAVQVLFGATAIAFLLAAPSAVLLGQFVNPLVPWTPVEWAVLGTSVLHAFAYGGYFALVARAGPVFTSQVAYLVTGSGVLWSMLLLGETYSGWVWAAFGLMLVGIVLLKPRRPKVTP